MIELNNVKVNKTVDLKRSVSVGEGKVTERSPAVNKLSKGLSSARHHLSSTLCDFPSFCSEKLLLSAFSFYFVSVFMQQLLDCETRLQVLQTK